MTTTVLDGFTLCLPFFESDSPIALKFPGKLESTSVRLGVTSKPTKPRSLSTQWVATVDHPGKIRIAQIVRHNPVISSNEISYKVESSTGNLVSPRTIRRTLSWMRYDRRKPRNVPMLTKRHIEARMKFAQDNLDRDWTKVLFSDCLLYTSPSPRDRG